MSDLTDRLKKNATPAFREGYVRQLLAEWRALEGAATPEPWWHINQEGTNNHAVWADHARQGNSTSYYVGDLATDCEGVWYATEDAAFITTSRTAMPRLIKAAEEVLWQHRPVEVEPSDTICRECSYQLPNGRFFGKVVEWPCPTVEAITTALIGEVHE